ncbi:uncharacterized protein N7503_001713 [Penicillium pulvis]|uniref:uncharacterized protein n=1 Tax=Penicillium pulvis TaxID=1562058 RepID=UPI0025489F07|nr:uncharacterized protein N7503_001713 [Penicillium pulvis]KAJ5809495.1 hypothetical protein N7503_001713 [Penicillium pulvis]
MCEFHEDDEPQAASEIKGHKRNLSNRTADASPVRRSKRQRSTINLKEQSSSDESEEENDLKVTLAKSKQPKKSRAPSSSKKVESPEAKAVSDVTIVCKEPTEVKAEGDATASTQKAKPTPAKRGKKTKEQKELEAMPLAPRTQGLKIGNAFALFLKSQRKWDNPALLDEHRDQFRKLCEEKGYDAAKHVLPHGSYLVNLAQGDKAKAKQAYDSFLDDLRRCEALGIKLYNFHPGSTNQTPLPDALSRLASTLTKAISETSTVIPVLETMCGHGNTIGGALSEFKDLLALIPKEHHSRIGICIDTCHSFAAGYDLASPKGFKAFLDEFEKLIGIQFLKALHLNDSKAPFGSKRDLHANIGTGFLGLRAFHNVMNEPRFEGLPMVLETPIDRTEGEVADEGSESESGTKKKGKKAKRLTGASAPTVQDPGVWAREIKLLESLIGMDPEGEEFKALEAKLSEQGRETREKQQEQHDRKVETEKKKEAKEKAKGQKSLVDMMKGGK